MNIDIGSDLTIKELSELITKIVGFEGQIIRDTTKSNGTPRKLQDVSRLHAQGWYAKMELEEGIRKAYNRFLDNY